MNGCPEGWSTVWADRFVSRLPYLLLACPPAFCLPIPSPKSEGERALRRRQALNSQRACEEDYKERWRMAREG